MSSAKMDHTVSGTVDASTRKIGSQSISSEVQIIDVNSADQYSTANFVSVFLQRIDGVKLSSSDILYYEKNSKNEISALILNDVTGDTYQYGVVTSARGQSSNMNISGSYTYDIDGVSQTVSTNGSIYNVSSGQPAMFFVSDGRVESIQPLQQISGYVQEITNTTVTNAKGDVYLLASNVAVYQKTSSYQFLKIPLEDVIDNDEYKISAYYDKSQQGGGRIRVLLAEKK